MELPDIEVVAAAVHDSWMAQKRLKGVTSAPSQQTGEEQMRPYAELSDAVQEYDRATVKAVYAAIESAQRTKAEAIDANLAGQKRQMVTR